MLRSKEERVVLVRAGNPEQFGRMRGTIWRIRNGAATAETQDLRPSLQSGAGGPEVVAAQWPCLAQGCPWGLGLDGD